MKRIYEWSKGTRTAASPDFDVEPDVKVWAQVCSERGLCSPKILWLPVDFGKHHDVFSSSARATHSLVGRARAEPHALLHAAGGIEEEIDGGILFKNDFVIFDEAHQMEHVASKHSPERLERRCVTPLNALESAHGERPARHAAKSGAVKLVAELLSESDKFFEQVEAACDELSAQTGRSRFGRGETRPARAQVDGTAHPPAGTVKDNVRCHSTPARSGERLVS